ncbi:hypothetical protein R1sor_021153 [Riccia sorocarpa]|uniref:Methyltransferase FkbM domain-containing protein n=1 Tax=Riccia sorocarpa TaxID=122646 RepID=A0ABD3GG81_9MARC
MVVLQIILSREISPFAYSTGADSHIQSPSKVADYLYPSRWTTTERSREDPVDCTKPEAYFEDDGEYEESENPWSQVKWIGQPAACRVRGELIERLDVVNNFRRGYALRFAQDVEDRTHILPWMLGARVDLNRRKRRVFLDLGSNTFSSSIEWFIQMYPCDFTEIYAFEKKLDLLIIPSGFSEQDNWAVGATGAERTKARPGVPSWIRKRIKVYNEFVSDVDDPDVSAVNITRFIKQELKLTAEDAVMVKMDIEDSEWPVLERWLNDGEMVQIVDEIFVEVHYNHSSMFNFNWNKFTHERNQAKRLLANLRWKGYYIHFWP